MAKIINSILDFFYPKFCLSCGKENVYLCHECFLKIKIFDSPFCPYCKTRSFNGKIHKECSKNLSGFVAATSYSDDLLRKVIDAFKYNFVMELKDPLAFLILKFLKENPEIEFFKNPIDFLILPVPLHDRRLHWRGFNQSTRIGKVLSPILKIPLKEDVLFRKKDTPPQSKIKNVKEKMENIQKSFFVKNTELTRNKKIILLDDVATSLSTMEEAAKELKQNGVEEIWGLSVAKG